MNELLMPAGSIEKMKYAFSYGADAVYLGLVDFSLRALRKGELIDETNLKTAVEIANSLGKKIYCTLNIFAYDNDIKKLEQTVEIITPDNVSWWQTCASTTFANSAARTTDGNGFVNAYRVLCIDVDGAGKGEAPFGYAVRYDGKIIPGKRADDWTQKSVQRGE